MKNRRRRKKRNKRRRKKRRTRKRKNKTMEVIQMSQMGIGESNMVIGTGMVREILHLLML